MKRECGEDERAIRGGIYDILWFLSGRTATPEELGELRRKVHAAVRVFRKEETALKEKVS